MSTSAMHVAKTGLTAQQYKMQVIANNLANVNTTGFKRDRANFESLFYQIVKTAGAQTADDTALTSPLAVGTGVKVVSTQKLFTQGGLVNTDNSLDLAIDGQGFFQALLPDGRVGYTRSGILSRNAEGVLTTTSGYVLQPQIQMALRILMTDKVTELTLLHLHLEQVARVGNTLVELPGLTWLISRC